MDETLRQVGGLLLGSVPTIIFFLLLFGLYTALVHRPLTQVLRERYARTQGAIQQARTDTAIVEARTAAYEQKLKEARIALFKAQEARRAQAAQTRTAALAEARDKAEAQVEQARAVIEKEMAAAKSSLDAEAGRLASEIVRVVLESSMAQAPAGGR
jgi:F-type H+-transporting ATPase subunit b